MTSATTTDPSGRPQHQVKIVYWGPGESGKTTNYEYLKKVLAAQRVSTGFSVETTTRRTLWQDSIYFQFPMEAAEPFTLVTQIATCTGQERFLGTREYVIDGADGVVFVADSDPAKMRENLRSYRELVTFSRRRRTPILVQLNKRDLPGAISVAAFKQYLGLPDAEVDSFGHRIVYEAEAQRGVAVLTVFSDMIERILFRGFGY
jgi:signal recognition particle receptor subunit beta